MIDHAALFPPGATARDWANDTLLAGSLSLGAVVSSTFYGYHLTAPQTLLLMLVQLAMTLPLAFRRHTPLLTLALCTVAGFMQAITLSAPTLSLTAVPIVIYSVARWVPGGLARIAIVIGAAGAVIGPLGWFNVQYPAGVTAYILYWGRAWAPWPPRMRSDAASGSCSTPGNSRRGPPRSATTCCWPSGSTRTGSPRPRRAR